MGGGPFEDYLRKRGIPVVVRRRRARFDPTPAIFLWDELRSWRPHVVHAWGWMPALAAGPLCRLLGIPCVDGMIRSGALEPDFTRLKRLGMASATLVVANSRAGLRAWGISPAKGRLVYNGFDETRLAAVAKDVDEPRTDREGFTVIMTGRMTPVKDFDVVIEAAELLSRAEDGWRFLLVGDGPDRERLMHRGGSLMESGVIAFPEPTMEILGLVRQADVGVLMTNPRLAKEGLSNSIMEYMALGLPVICGEGGGNPELVLDGVTGFVVRPGDAGELADRLSALRRNPELCAAMGAAGRARIGREFSLETMVRTMLRVYAEALDIVQGPPRPRRSCPSGR
jgi:glycosyltransferase involved in cell wall biosynthesis